VIVLILVAVLWIAVLVPTVISKFSERRSAGSIDHFHERLDLLERTGPKLVAPAYRLTGTESPPSPTGAVVVAAAPLPVRRPNLILVPPGDDAPRPPETLFEDPIQPEVRDEVVVRLHRWAEDTDHSEHSDVSELSVVDERQLVAADRRRIARKRRRDVFGALCALAALSGLLGLVHSLRAAWIASAVFVGLLLVFVALAMYGQRIEAERRHMEQLRRAEQARVVDDEVESGTVKYLSEEDLAHYYEVEDARLAAEA
jgi:hypothetical protein